MDDSGYTDWLFNYNLYKTTYKTELTISHQTNNKTSIGLVKTHFEADKETTIEEKRN